MKVSDPSSVWWEQIGSSLRLLKNIEKNMEDGISAVLRIETELPWKDRFYECVDRRKELVGADRQLRRLTAPEDAEPGEYILEQLCPPNVRAEYYPGISYAEFLGGRRDLVLCDCYVWIDGIRKPEKLQAWIQFVSEYEQAGGDSRKAVFFLEYTGPAFRDDRIEWLTYQAAGPDCRVLCLELSELPEKQMEYQTELAMRIGGKDPELIAALMENGEKLTEDPGFSAEMTFEFKKRSDGTAFAALPEGEVTSAVKYAAMVVFFPVIERKRVSLIAAHEKDVAAMLPITNSNGEKVTDPFDVEIGSLYYLASRKYIFSPEEFETVKLCRRVRNQMAHNGMVDYTDIQILLGQ